MSEALLEQYIRNQIFILEKNSYYESDLLEEGKILDFFKNSFSKVKDFFIANPDREETLRNQVEKYKERGDLENAEKFDEMLDSLQTGTYVRQNAVIFALLCSFIFIKETNKGKTTEQAAQTTIEQVDKSLQSDNTYDISDTDLAEPLENRGFEGTKLSQEEMMKAMYLLTGTSVEDFKEATPQQQAKDDLDEFFFSYMSLSGDGVYPSTFDDMEQEDYEIFVDQFESFIAENATTFNEKEYNQAMSLLYMASASKRLEYPTEENPFTTEVIIKNTKKGLTALQSYKNSIENVASTIGDISEENQGEALKVAQRIAQGQLNRLEELRESAKKQGLDTSAYDGWIDDCKDIYMKQFGHDIDEDLDGNL